MTQSYFEVNCPLAVYSAPPFAIAVCDNTRAANTNADFIFLAFLPESFNQQRLESCYCILR